VPRAARAAASPHRAPEGWTVSLKGSANRGARVVTDRDDGRLGARYVVVQYGYYACPHTRLSREEPAKLKEELGEASPSSSR
jgi:hypothetical protein